MQNLDIKIRTGSYIEPYIEEIAQLRIQIFRDYPYLYDGSAEYEMRYLKTYTESKNSIAVLIFDDKKLVGVSTGIPMRDETPEFRKPFLNHGYNPDEIFYCGESILKKEYRGQGVYTHFFSDRESHARQLAEFTHICFCGVVRPDNHPLKPVYFQPLDPVWEKFGYTKMPHLVTTYRWKDINETEESKKEMMFWMKEL